MNDFKNEHWSDIAKEVGADVPPPPEETPEDVSPVGAEQGTSDPSIDTGTGDVTTEVPPTDARQDVDSPKRPRPPKRPTPLPKNHWQTLAQGLGVSVPDEPYDEEPAELDEPSDSSLPTYATPTETAAIPVSSRPFLSNVLDEQQQDPVESFIDELPERDAFEDEPETEEIEERPLADEAETEIETDADAIPDEASAATESHGRKPRRRRGKRGRRRRTSKKPEDVRTDGEGEGGADSELEQGSLDHAVLEPDDEPAGSANAERSEPSGGPRSKATRARRRPRGRGRRAEPEPAEASDSCPAEQPSDPEQADSAASDDPSDAQQQRGRVKRGSRRFPTWAEAVDIVVSTNIESRQKSGSSGGSRGRKRRSGGKRR